MSKEKAIAEVKANAYAQDRPQETNWGTPTIRTGNKITEEWLIRKSGYFYRPNCSGYTQNVDEAGRYTEKFAKDEVAIEPHRMSAHHISEFPGSTAPKGDEWRYDQIRWSVVYNVPFEYAIQQGPHGDEFVKLLDGSCLRRKIGS